MVSISVSLAEIKFSRNQEDIIIVHGLGSCIGVVIYDYANKLGGMAHVVLPDSSIQPNSPTPGRFADTAIPVLMDQFKLLGGNLMNSFVKIAGGSNMFKYDRLATLDIGRRNTESVIDALKKYNIVPLNKDVGGTSGRTVKLHIATGKIYSRMIGMQEKEL
ncbi:MAG: hypothetical protein A2Y40_00740 [Candidatus Margulisbacteria bacterium GWF2_35_9]|nr:MAG: hypothetical protein A2Y40_00740 [Candidatus Margulisbacteria bacterium GWF2_35_9]